MGRHEGSNASPIAAIARGNTLQARESSALALAQQLVSVAADSNEKLSTLLGVDVPPSSDVRPHCLSARARRALTTNGMWNSRTLLESSVSQLLDLRNCGPRSVEEILASLLVALTSPAIHEHLPIDDEEVLSNYRPIIEESVPLTVQGFMAAIRGRRNV
ncbi:DNA-directed RNA polymerase subunit alpha C-terminal domain-containing protein [Streptomyces flaveus]|uniref:RNA polymerase alpha subunit C-terminal domain-containing protein n=1 Tax=Streptomyces flaveus TaxID=66370 RepID=A0A917VQ42_9ACTN|nr:DNA-directed RNA polymerase subunit alpha C-terminal domain-containing protein [Streptomyces flaveus]GGL03171.1 hypothetical protein GCM10010094_74960 [Streptomyces flaveus]